MSIHRMNSIFYLDIPTEECVGNPDAAWKSIGEFKSKQEAVAFIREHFGPCDNEGRIDLITEGTK